MNSISTASVQDNHLIPGCSYRKSTLMHYFSRLLFHAGKEDMICTELQRLGLILPARYHLYLACIAPLLPADSYIYTLQERNLSFVTFVPLITDSDYGVLLILYHAEEEEMPISELLSCFCIDAETQLHMKITIGYSSSSRHFTSLPELYEQAGKSLSFLKDSGSNLPLLPYQDIHTEETQEKDPDNSPVYSQNVQTMRSYIHRNYMNDITSKNVAGEVYLSVNYANTLFMQECGMSIFDYLVSYRMEKAKELLTGSEETITKIAELIGYGSKTSFYLAFKRHTDMSPTEYRQQYTPY